MNPTEPFTNPYTARITFAIDRLLRCNRRHTANGHRRIKRWCRVSRRLHRRELSFAISRMTQLQQGMAGLAMAFSEGKTKEEMHEAQLNLAEHFVSIRLAYWTAEGIFKSHIIVP